MPFVKGQSGNPGGKPDRSATTRRMLEGLSINAVKRLEQLIRSDNEPVALGACREVLSRVVPTPKANILAIGASASAEHLQALVALATRAGDRLVQPQIGDSTQSVKQPILIDAKPLEPQDT